MFLIRARPGLGVIRLIAMCAHCMPPLTIIIVTLHQSFSPLLVRVIMEHNSELRDSQEYIQKQMWGEQIHTNKVA